MKKFCAFMPERKRSRNRDAPSESGSPIWAKSAGAGDEGGPPWPSRHMETHAATAALNNQPRTWGLGAAIDYGLAVAGAWLAGAAFAAAGAEIAGRAPPEATACLCS